MTQPTPMDAPQAPDTDRLPWATPAITAISLAGETETGTAAFSSESSFPNDQRYAS